MEDPPELLRWARDTLNGIPSLRGKSRRREIELSDEVHGLLLQISRDLEAIVERNDTTDPARWADLGGT